MSSPSRTRRCLLACDMEGLAGVDGWHHCMPGTPGWWQTGRPALARQARAAVEGLLEGFDEVVVVDGHANMTNLDQQVFLGLPVRLVQGDLYELTMVPGVGLTDGLALLGTHAGPVMPGYGMAHAISGRFKRILVDGRSVGETGLNILAAAGTGVPTIAVHGDLPACEEARVITGCPDLPVVLGAVTEKGVRRARDLDTVCDELRTCFGHAARLAKNGQVPPLPESFSPCRLQVFGARSSRRPLHDITADTVLQAYGWLLDDMRYKPRSTAGVDRGDDVMPVIGRRPVEPADAEEIAALLAVFGDEPEPDFRLDDLETLEEFGESWGFGGVEDFEDDEDAFAVGSRP